MSGDEREALRQELEALTRDVASLGKELREVAVDLKRHLEVCPAEV